MTRNERKRQSLANLVKFFQKHAVEGKSVSQCSREMNLGRSQLHSYKRSDDFRQMALAELDENIGGVSGVVSRLVKALDAVRPHNKETVNADGSTNIEVEWVADNNTRDKALSKVIDIYGLKAPKQSNVKVELSLSSDAELFAEIDEAARSCKLVQSYEKGKDGFGLVKAETRDGTGDFESRERALLQGASVSEQDGRVAELAVQDNMESAEI